MVHYYSFSVGNFSCASVSDGELNYPVGSFFKDIPPDRAEAILRDRDLPTTHVYTPYALLYIKTGSHKVLVDTGIGKYGSLAGRMFPDVDNTTSRLGTVLENMIAAGINPEEVDTVIITHAHPDHIGGNYDAENQLNFPNARYFIWKDEWDFWFDGARTTALKVPPPMVQVAREGLEPIRDMATLLDSEGEIVPGISAVATPGHTPGHIALLIMSGQQQLLHISDAVIHPVHLERPEILTAFDIVPEQTLASKRALCNRAAEEKALVFAHHFPPFPNLGHIAWSGEGWQWQPVRDME